MINIPVAITLYITFKEIFIESFPDSESFIWQLTVLVVLYLTAMSNYCMVSTAMTDPGVVPGRRWQEYVSERYDQPKDKTDFYTWYLQLNQRVSPHIYKFTFCKTCQIFQPPRCNHCPICAVCTLELDHHCHWLGTCLGARNYRTFYWFVVHTVLLSILELSFIPIYLWRVSLSREVRDQEEEFILTWPEWIVLPIIWIYVAAITSWIFKLCIFHACFVTTSGRTAYEMIKGHYMDFTTSPHKKGSSCTNFCLLVCCKRRKVESRLNWELEMANEDQNLD